MSKRKEAGSDGRKPMPMPLIHIGVAALGLLLYVHDRRWVYALLLVPLAVLPDIDHFVVPHAARVILHNVFILVPPLAVALYGRATRHAVLWDVGLFSSFCLISHLVLDFFGGNGEALLFPLTTARVGFVGRPAFVFKLISYEFLPKSLWPYSVEALSVLLCIIAFAGILLIKRLFQFPTDEHGSVHAHS